MESAAMAVDWLQKVLAHHDPLGAWPPTASSNRDYGLEARLVFQRLRGIHGLSHVRTLLAEALDQLHPGLSGALEQQGELRVRLGRVAQEIRQAPAYRSGINSVGAAHADPSLAVVTAPPASMTDEPGLLAWLSYEEDVLRAEQGPPTDGWPVAAAFHAELLAVIAAYVSASDTQRETIRRAFSGFRWVLWQVSNFAARQSQSLDGANPTEALRNALVAESILDLGTDSRDELLSVRELRGKAESAGLPFEALVRQAAAYSSPRTAKFLSDLLAEH
jgi:hypothetical protein